LVGVEAGNQLVNPSTFEKGPKGLPRSLSRCGAKLFPLLRYNFLKVYEEQNLKNFVILFLKVYKEPNLKNFCYTFSKSIYVYLIGMIKIIYNIPINVVNIKNRYNKKYLECFKNSHRQLPSDILCK
jgi:hypothetical protein